MGIMDGFRWLLGREEPAAPVQTRAGDSVDDLLARRAASLRSTAWRYQANRDALGVPAIWRAVSLIANTTGVLSFEGYRNGAKLTDDQTPNILIRPNPFTTPRVFNRDVAAYLARLGEAWLWVAKRDIDGGALSVIPVDPREVTVEENTKNRYRPKISWLGTVMPNEDFRQITLMADPADPLRGWGPLQACGAAVSVAVEAQDYAANYFAGNPANTLIRSTLALDPTPDPDTGLTEAMLIKQAWIADSSGLPKVVDPGIGPVEDIGPDPAKAQLTETRSFQNGEVALMFGIPGTLLEHFTPGSSLTYQNVGQEFDKFVRSCLWPNYLEPIEQEMSDLLPRATITRYNVLGLLRPDAKTRADIYNILIPLGVMDTEQAQEIEGFTPGDVETRPVPQSPPQAVPPPVPALFGPTRMAQEVRCAGKLVIRGRMQNCGRILGKLAAPYEVQCPRCKNLAAA